MLTPKPKTDPNVNKAVPPNRLQNPEPAGQSFIMKVK